MKTTAVTASTQTTHPQVEQLLKEAEPRILSEAILESKDYGMAGKPSTNDSDLTTYTRNTSTSFQKVMATMWKVMKADTALAEGAAIKMSLPKEKEELEATIDPIKEQIRLQDMEMRNHNNLEYIFNKWFWIKIIIGVLLAGEVIFNFKIFSVLTNGNLFASGVFALGLSAVLVALSLGQDKILKTVKPNWKKWLYSILLLSLTIGMFTGLAYIRIAFWEIKNESIADNIHPAQYILLNLAFYIGSIALTYLYMPNKTEREAYTQYKEAKKKKDALEQELALVQERIKEIPLELEKRLNDYYATIVMTANYEVEIEAMHQSILGEFIKTNITIQGGDTPPVFLQDLPTLETKYKQIINQENN